MEGNQMARDHKTDVTDHSCSLANLVTHIFLHKLDQKVWGLLSGLTETLFCRFSKPSSLSFYSQGKCFSPDHTNCLLLSPAYWCVPSTGNFKIPHGTLHMVCSVLSGKSSHFPWSAGCASAHTTQGAAGPLCCLWTERTREQSWFCSCLN